MSRTVKHHSYRPAVQALNVGAGLINGLGAGLDTLDPERLMAQARRKTGLSDFGAPDFREPMERLLEAFGNAPLSAFGRMTTSRAVWKALNNRLWVADLLERHPEIRDVPLERPIFVLGFPRTGTTVLQNLLALHPDRRGLEFWEIVRPAPMSDDHGTDRKRRIADISWVLRIAYFMAPEMAEVHHIEADTLEECWPLLLNTFGVLNYDLQSGLTAYGDFLCDEYDMRKVYREYREYLQVLGWWRPPSNLILKCPEHLWFLDAILEVFPDACIVWTHRDPYKSIASYCSLISLQWRTIYGRFDPEVIGEHVTNRFHQGIERATAACAGHDPARVFHVDFTRLVKDQASTVRRICEHFDLPYGDGMDDAIATWLDNKRADKRGAHKYQPELYGLDRGRIHERYADYIERFEVPVKRK